jgi:alcohol dehydrogenase
VRGATQTFVPARVPKGTYSVSDSHVSKIIAGSRGSSMKSNPRALTDAEIAGIERASLYEDRAFHFPPPRARRQSFNTR